MGMTDNVKNFDEAATMYLALLDCVRLVANRNVRHGADYYKMISTALDDIDVYRVKALIAYYSIRIDLREKGLWKGKVSSKLKW